MGLLGSAWDSVKDGYNKAAPVLNTVFPVAGLGTAAASRLVSTGSPSEAVQGAIRGLPVVGDNSNLSTSSLAGGGGGGGGASLDQATQNINAQVALANAQAQKYQGAYDAYSGPSAPMISQATLGPAAQAGYVGPIDYGSATAGYADAAQLGPAAQAGYAPSVVAQQVQAERVAQQAAIQAQQVQAERIQAARAASGPAAVAQMASATPVGSMAQAQNTYLASPAYAQAAKIDMDPQAQFRANQTDLVSGLQGTIAGNDPSVAAIMLRQATDRNISSQYALAQAANGMNSGAASRQAMINAAEANQQSIGQQALLRAQEIATARGQLGSALDSARGADTGLASNQAGLQQQTNLANQGAVNTNALQQGTMNQQVALANQVATNQGILTQAQIAAAAELQNAGASTDVSKFNSGQAQALNLANAGFQQDASKVNAANALSASQGNQTANLAASTTNATLAQQVALANAANALSASQGNQSANLSANTTNSTLAQGVNLANIAAQNQQSQAAAQLQNAVNLQNAQGQTQASIANAGNYTNAQTTGAQLNNAVNLANASAQNQTSQKQADLSMQAQTNNQNAILQNNQQNTTARQNLAQNALAASGQSMAGVGTAANAAAAANAANVQKTAATDNLLGSLGAAYLASDRRVKTDITDSQAEIAEFTRAIKPQSWRYKDPELPGAAPGQRYGVMAQDLEKSKIGRSLVSEGPDGVKRIDSNQAVGAILATLSQMNKRLDRAEARR